MKKQTFTGLALSDSEKAAVAGWVASMDRLWNLLSNDVWGKGNIFNQNNPDEGAIARGLDPFFLAYYNGFMAILQHTPGVGNLEKALQKCRTSAEGHVEAVLREVLHNREGVVKAWEQSLSGNLPNKAQQLRKHGHGLEREFHNAQTTRIKVRHFLDLLKTYDKFINVAKNVRPAQATRGSAKL